MPEALAWGLHWLRFDIHHVSEELGPGHTDNQVAEMARRLGAIVVTRDDSFHEHELIAQALAAGDLLVVTMTFPKEYETFVDIRDAVWVLLEELEDKFRHGVHQLRCRVRAPRGHSRNRGRPALQFTVPGRASSRA